MIQFKVKYMKLLSLEYVGFLVICSVEHQIALKCSWFLAALLKFLRLCSQTVSLHIKHYCETWWSKS